MYVEWIIHKDNGKYHKANTATYSSERKKLTLWGHRWTLRGTLARYHVRTFKDIESVTIAKKKLRDLGFRILDEKVH